MFIKLLNTTIKFNYVQLLINNVQCGVPNFRNTKTILNIVGPEKKTTTKTVLKNVGTHEKNKKYANIALKILGTQKTNKTRANNIHSNNAPNCEKTS